MQLEVQKLVMISTVVHTDCEGLMLLVKVEGRGTLIIIVPLIETLITVIYRNKSLE